MNNQKYWEERAILKDKLLEKDINKLEKKLLKLFKDTRKEVLNELKIIYADIEASEYAKYQIDSLLTSVNNALDNLYSNNEKEIIEGLKGIYKEMDKQASIDLNNAFNTVNIGLAKEVTSTNWGTTLNNYELDKYGMKKGVFATHDEVLEKIIDDLINSNWSGLTLVERIAEHKRKLSLTLKEELSKGLVRGDSLQDISKIFSKKIDLSYSNALRIIRTESCWVMNEATVNNYKENGIKEYEFMAFLDKKTSKQCRDLDGKKFSIEEYKAGVNLPPLHPNCRSCILPIIDQIEKPKEVEKENITDILKNKGVIVKDDTFKKIDGKLYEENAKQLNKLFEKYPKAQEYIKNTPFTFKAEKMSKGVIASCGNNIKDDKASINLAFDSYLRYEDHIKQTKENSEAGWSSKCKDKYLSVNSITHEFGHFIHNIMISDYNKNNPAEFEKAYKSIMSASTLSTSKTRLRNYRYKIIKTYNKEIINEAKKIDKNFNSKENIISKYGKSSPAEFFAECFAEYECDGTTVYAKAMKEFLKKRGFIK